jgi:hypothetical protein
VPIPPAPRRSLVLMATQATPEPPTTLLTPVDVARLANVSLSTVRREIEPGALRAATSAGSSASTLSISTATSTVKEPTVARNPCQHAGVLRGQYLDRLRVGV